MTSESQDIAQGLRNIFTESLRIDLPPNGVGLISGGMIDSLTLVELLFQIEVEFGIKLDFQELEIDDFETLETIGQLIARSGRPYESRTGERGAFSAGSGPEP
jgi:acyl carrier protein